VNQDLPTASGIGEALRKSDDALALILAGRANSVPISADAKSRRLQGLFVQVESIDRLVPRETFDLDHVAAQVGRDPVKLHTWVREHITWVPYRGSLRGPRGTLMDHSGNSLDRALLLVRLLEVNGVRARLARALLTTQQAAELRQQQPASKPLAPTEVTEGLHGVIDAYARQTNVDAGQLRQQLQQATDLSARAVEDMRGRVATQTAMLVKGLTLEASTAADESAAEIAALTDHWWVQWQDQSRWVDLDPALAEAGRAVAAVQENVQPDALDAALHHTVQVRVVVEKWDGSKYKEQRAISVEVRPSEVLDQPLQLQHVPMAWPKDLGGPEQAPRLFNRALLAQSEWLPVFTIAGQRKSAASILDTGDLNDRPGASRPSPAASIADAFGGGDETPPGVLTAEWLEYEIRAPGRSPRVIRREIFDLAGGAARAAGRGPAALTEQRRLSRALSLMSETEILSVPCQLSSAFVVHLTASRLLQHKAMLTAVLQGTPMSAGIGLPGRLFALAVARGEWSRTPGAVYLREPNVLSRHVFFAETQGGFGVRSAIDIVASEVAARGPVPGRFMARLEQGVLDANLEAMIAGAAPVGLPVADLFGLADTGRWVAVRSDQDLAGLAQDDDTRARIAADIRAGFVVLARADPGASRNEIGWWRVDPRTGDTLSLGHRGWGQAMVEYKVAGTTVAIAGICIIGASLDGQVSVTERSVCGLLGVGALLGGVGVTGLVIIGAKGTGSVLLAGVFGAMLALIG
jgi:hypothetical protein